MAGFKPKTYKHYLMPNHVWSDINEYIPKDKQIWDSFYNDGLSGYYLKKLGCQVIHEPIDFEYNNLGDIIVTVPPFSISKSILDRLFELDKPFIILLPTSKINTQYFRKWKNKNIQIIIPRRRIRFTKNENEFQHSSYFDCFYYCYKMELQQNIIWLEE